MVDSPIRNISRREHVITSKPLPRIIENKKYLYPNSEVILKILKIGMVGLFDSWCAREGRRDATR